MAWTKLKFGKHIGKTLPQIVLSDPDWFFWAVENDVFQNKGKIVEEAIEIDHKARNIRIPPKEGGDRIAEYSVHPDTNKFCDMEIVPKDKPRHEGSTFTMRKGVIDLSTPREIASYDKSGCGLLLVSVKFYVFGDSKFRLTKARCELFFEDDSKFVLART